MKIKMILAFCTAAALTGCAIEPTISQEEIELATKHLHTKRALESYTVNYSEGEYHKAWAMSESGVWTWYLDGFTQEMAIEQALSTCRTYNKKYENKFPCKVINLDGQWLTN